METATKQKLIGDGDVFEIDGLKFKAEHKHDPHMGPPWKEHDGHGVVSDWTTRDKRPGERVIAKDGARRMYYDIEATMAIALKDGWGPPLEGKTKRESAAAAVESDFQNMKAWLDDEWYWLGVVVTLLDAEGNEIDRPECRDSLWGIESNSDAEYLDEVARDCARDIITNLGGKDTIEIRLKPKPEETAPTASAISYEQLRKLRVLAEQIAAMTREGEVVDGQPFEMSYEDAVATLNDLIDTARRIVKEVQRG